MAIVGVLVRRARLEDLHAVASLAGELVRVHHGFDARRFILPPHVEAGYERFFRHELPNEEVVILAAENEGQIIGYAYGRIEPRDWNMLLDGHGAVHDVFVNPDARRRGVGRELLVKMLAELRGRGARSVVLYSASPNAAAQRLFESLDFRSTMIEMTRELE
jgi:ribosomal protein S18 acetylase RimI-like enzyme